MRKRILITGTSGQLGNAVLNEFQDYEILAVDLIPTAIQSRSIEFKSLDITKKDEVKSVIQSFKPEIILNLAAMTDVDACEENPELAEEINSNCLNYFLDEFRGTFVQISTDYVFDGENGPYGVDSKPSPINYYGKSKLAAENAIRGGRNAWVILRTNVLYGAGGSPASFVRWVTESLKIGNEIRVVDDQYGNPTWTGSLAESIKLLIVLNSEGLFHYGGADFISRHQFALKVAETYNLDQSLIKKISTEELGQLAKRPLQSGLTTNKIEETVGIRTYGIGYCLRKVKEGVVA